MSLLQGDEHIGFTCSPDLKRAVKVYADAYDISKSQVIRWALAQFVGEENPHIRKQYLRDRHAYFEDRRDHFNENMRRAKQQLDKVRELENNHMSVYEKNEERRQEIIRGRVETLVRVAREDGLDAAHEALGRTKAMKYISPNELWSKVEERVGEQ